jgi:DNA repair exonuclease SbcCD ATPase subunit
VTQPPIETDLATAVIAVYQAPLEDFISRRDALAKQLRAEKRQDDAALVKALRKPSRMAWTLDGIVHEDPASIERLAAAIDEAQTGADLRAALETVKETVRAVAAVGARVATRAGHPIEPNALAAAVHAIIGEASAFAEFRAGRLVDVPQGGGLDLLTALAVVPPSARTSSSPSAATIPAIEPENGDPRVERAASARADLRGSEELLAERREQSEHAMKSLRDAKARFDTAEHALVQAQVELEARRDDVERTRQLAESATANLADAQRALADARARVAEFAS